MMPLRATAAVAAALLTSGAMADQFLLIMESAPRGTGRRIGRLFDPYNGSVVRDVFIEAAAAGMDLPTEAALIEDEIWVSDQIRDALFRFDLDGAFLGMITGGMDNIRGIEYVDGVVYVSNAGESGGAPGKAVVMFDADGNHLGSWPAGDPFDVVAFGGDLMISNIADDRLDVYRRNGEFLRTFSAAGINFPEQIAIKASDGNILAGGYEHPSGIYEYDRDTGDQVNFWPDTEVRGVYELGNGNILYTNNFGVHTLDPRTGAVTLITAEGDRFITLIDTSGSAGPCYADCDGSGSLDFFDFLCFQNQFAAGDPAADCDDSGSLDFFDFLCFQNAFAAGCA